MELAGQRPPSATVVLALIPGRAWCLCKIAYAPFTPSYHDKLHHSPRGLSAVCSLPVDWLKPNLPLMFLVVFATPWVVPVTHATLALD